MTRAGKQCAVETLQRYGFSPADAQLLGSRGPGPSRPPRGVVSIGEDEGEQVGGRIDGMFACPHDPEAHAVPGSDVRVEFDATTMDEIGGRAQKAEDFYWQGTAGSTRPTTTFTQHRH